MILAGETGAAETLNMFSLHSLGVLMLKGTTAHIELF